MQLGVHVTKVHRGVRFNQDYIFKKYIDTNTKLRSEALTELEKNFYKLLNNSLYGKTVENLKKRVKEINDILFKGKFSKINQNR